MNKSFKQWLAELLAIGLGKCIKMMPPSHFRKFIYDAVYIRYCGWRRMELVGQTVFGAKMRLTLPDSIQTKIFLTGTWEPSITKFISSTLRLGDIFVDIGANVGYYSLLASKIVGNAGKVYAFEASPSIFRRLADNASMNNAKNIVLHHVAVSNSAGECTIWISPEGNLGHSTIIDNVALADGHKKESLVRCDTLAALMPVDDLLQARIIKIDIEGAERYAIEGILQHLPDFSPSTEWLVEMSPDFSPGGAADVEWIFEKFVAAGYSGYLIENSYSNNYASNDAESFKLTMLHAAPADSLNDVIFTKRDISKLLT